MIARFFQILTVFAALTSGTVFAQCDSGCGSTNNCGREISQSAAADLWSGYCTETCYDHGSHRLFGNRARGNGGGGCGNQGCDSGCGSVGTDAGCGGGCRLGNRGGLHSRIGNRGGMSSGNCGSSVDGCGCGCDLGCFGYPASCDNGGCGDGNVGRTGGGRLHRHGRSCGGECGGGFLSRLFHHHGNCGGRFAGRSAGRFSNSADNCGCNGAYFGEAVGYEYGNAGMQSCVAGCGACDGGATAIAQPVVDHLPAMNTTPVTDIPANPESVEKPVAPADVPIETQK